MEVTPIQKSLVEQILEEMFTTIEGQEIFDAQIIQKLRQLVTSSELNKPAQVTNVIKSTLERTQ